MKNEVLTRRELLQLSTNLGLLIIAASILPPLPFAEAKDSGNKQATGKTGNIIDITIGKIPILLDGKEGTAIAMNGSVPGPPIRLQEGQIATIRVKNTLDEVTSIHWHGLILPEPMDGVPGVSFAGIQPGETFTYQFPVVQSGTYWCHSHSGGQEQLGVYAPLIIEPKEKDPIVSERDYIVMLSDWSFMDPMMLIAKLKKQSGYFNYHKRTVGDFLRDQKTNGFLPAVSERLRWMKMRMDPTDILDITGSNYTYLLNGLTAEKNWTGLFKKGERVRLRFINGSAMTIFDVRIPGLQMKVVQADGQDVQPVPVDEFRFGPGETYDVIVQPSDEKAYAVFAEAMDRSGYTMGTLAPQQGTKATIPERRQPFERTMDDMGMAMNMPGMNMQGMNMGGTKTPPKAGSTDMKSMDHTKMNMPGMDMSKMDMGGMDMSKAKKASSPSSPIPGSTPVKHGPDKHGSENSFVPEEAKSRLSEPGTGLGKDGRKVLVYTDLKSTVKNRDLRAPTREIELHLTGNMDRYMWSINGKKYSDDSDPILFHYGERVRLTLVNDTMMEHPMHLHGMFMEVENGHGDYLPRKHTIIVKPAERLSLAITADALGDWAFHCHMLYHMELGMFRVVRVAKENAKVQS